MTLAEAIRQVRAVHGMTQKELSLALDHGQTWCSRIEAGVREPTVLDLTILSNDFGLSLVRGDWGVKAPSRAKTREVAHA